jgi:hypothetical protein
MSRHRGRPVPPPKLESAFRTQAFTENFAYGLHNWKLYDSVGHDGAGVRDPEAIELDRAGVRIHGDSTGRTGGMQLLHHAIFRGRVDVEMFVPPGAGKYHPVVLLWGQGSGDSVDAITGEIDIAEFWNRPQRNVSDFTLHWGDGTEMSGASCAPKLGDFNTYSVTWTATQITAELNGVTYWQTGELARFPQVPMDVCLQLDWFPNEPTSGGSADMYVSSVRIRP